MAEAAGLAFAVLSLLVSALENYDECASVSRAWFGYEREFKRVSRRIKRFDLQYRVLLERLLLPVASATEWQAIVADPWHSDWSKMETRLRQRFQPHELEVYLETMEELSSTMHQLQHKLLVDDGKVNGQQLGTMQVPQSKVKRLKFAFGERSRGRILDEVQSLLGDLRFFIDGHECVSRDLQRSTRSIGLSLVDQQFWRCANLFHAAIVSVLSCSCSPAYDAHLDLTYENHCNVQPRVLLDREAPAQAPSRDHRNWSSLTMTVSLAELPSPLAPPMPQTPQVGPPPPKKRFGRLPFRKKGKQLALPAVQTPASPSQLIHATTPGNSISPQLAANGNICRLVPSSHNISQGRLDLPATSQSTGGFINFIMQETAPSSLQADAVSLTTWLSTLPGEAARSISLLIATKVVWSHLPQPSDSTLVVACNSDDIIFKQSTGHLDLTHPYLRRQYVAPRSSFSGHRSSSSFVPIGLTLIQLCFVAPLEHTKIGQLWPHADYRPDNRVAALWAQQVLWAIGPHFADAVEWCLQEHAAPGDELVQEYYRNVIQPVHECYDWYTKKRSS